MPKTFLELQPCDDQLIRHKIDRIVGRHQLSAEDGEDAAQLARLHLCRQLSKYDPSRGRREACVATILDNFFLTFLDRRAKRRRRRPPPIPLAQIGGEDSVASRSLGPDEAVRLAIDLAAVLARLPVELRALAEALLAHLSVSAAARALGVHRGTAYRRLKRLRAALREVGLNEF